MSTRPITTTIFGVSYTVSGAQERMLFFCIGGRGGWSPPENKHRQGQSLQATRIACSVGLRARVATGHSHGCRPSRVPRLLVRLMPAVAFDVTTLMRSGPDHPDPSPGHPQPVRRTSHNLFQFRRNRG
jgi:hypothetical protein